MRKILLAVMPVVLLTTTCRAQNGKETIEGNGKMISRDVAVQSFNELKASGIYELKLSQGERETVRIEADENLQEYFTVHNDGATLVIDTKKLSGRNLNIKSKNKLRVYVTFKKLKDLELSTVGNVSGDDNFSFDDLNLQSTGVGNINLKLTADKVALENKSVGNVTLSGKAGEAVMLNKGVGNIHAGNFVVQTLNIDNSGVGNAEVNAEKELKVRDSFLGKVKNRGAASVRKMGRVVI